MQGLIPARRSFDSSFYGLRAGILFALRVAAPPTPRAETTPHKSVLMRFGLTLSGHTVLVVTVILLASGVVPICRSSASAQHANETRIMVPTRNAAPRQGYAISLTFAGLPAPLTEISAYARYEVSNRDCVPIDYSRAIGGVKLPPEYHLDLVLQPHENSTFLTQVFTDALADADPYGLGPCKWGLQGVTVAFRSPTTHFLGGVTIDEIRAAIVVAKHYLILDFLEAPKVGERVFGEGPDYYLKALGPHFTLTLAPQRSK